MKNSIKELRSARSESLSDVASAVGMDRAQLHRVERGLGRCSYEKMLALAGHFGVPITELFHADVVDTTPTNSEVPA